MKPRLFPCKPLKWYQIYDRFPLATKQNQSIHWSQFSSFFQNPNFSLGLKILKYKILGFCLLSNFESSNRYRIKRLPLKKLWAKSTWLLCRIEFFVCINPWSQKNKLICLSVGRFMFTFEVKGCYTNYRATGPALHLETFPENTQIVAVVETWEGPICVKMTKEGRKGRKVDAW